MQARVLFLRPFLLFAGLALAVVCLEIAVVRSAAFQQKPDWVALGLTFDMLIGLPLLYYFLLVRRLKVPLRSLFGIFGLALSLTALILPTNYQQFVGLLRRSLLLVELGIVGYALLRINQIRRYYRQFSAVSADFMTNLLQSLDAVLGHSRFNRILVSELSILRYSLLGWWLPVEKKATDIVFTSHRESGQTALTMGLLLIGIIETTVVHLLIDRWDSTSAWLATAASFYSLLFIVADLVATGKRPVLVRSNDLVLRFGLRGYGTIQRKQIGQIVPITNKPEHHANTMMGTFLTVPNIFIELTEPVTMTGLLGSQRTVRRIALFIDDKQKFINELTA
ncbi:hypothetical protein WBJ53_03175 [Spirosoma sp. SC4-14]|uniref:hypothetical protein n=1 Tax=Spirosoma sp. SC4-14 TaxID=3128900 RepID=UPI0030D5B7FA